MKRTSLNKVLSLAIEFFGDKDKALSWWISKNPVFKNKSPYEICKEGKGYQVTRLLEQGGVEYAIRIRRTNGFS